ncbi:hypothetical protein [Bacillus subtilis]|uniref:hypothetical protein n=1 Tax=Bacillus subtilis TaxID=1423 RepID=UPI000849ED5D|nr:hypothetical protein [Bacillus subtilis]ODV47917.1 hypothetical protein BCM26_05780 [Bacillus subtilis]OJH63515.1 hypothetical protein BOH71_09725 [Bacillus subtilis]
MGKTLSVRSKYPNSAYEKNKKKQTEISSNQKKDKQKRLLEKLKEKNSEIDNSSTKQENNNEKVDLKYKNLYKELKKEVKALEKQLHSKTEELNKTKAENTSKDQELAELKEKAFKLTNINDSLTKKYSNLQEEKENEEKYFQKQIHELNLRLSETTDKLESREYLDKRYENIKNANKGYIQHINKIKQQVLTKDKEIHDLKQNINTLKRNLNKQKEINEAYTNLSPNFIIHTLIESLTTSNYKEFSLINDLYRKFCRIERGLKLFNRVGQQQEKKVEYELFGNMYKKFDEFVFVDLEGKEYSIREKPNYGGFTNGIPVTAFPIDDNSVVVTYVYRNFIKEFSMEAEISRNANTKPIEDKEDKKDSHFNTIGDFNVLVVSSRNGVKYRDRLKLHGLEADAVDGFEVKSRTLDLMDKADVVILCVDSMAHAFNDYAKQQNDPKYQYIYNANEEKVISRVIYAKHILGL